MPQNIWLLKENFNALTNLDTGFTLDSLQFVGQLEASNKYDSTKKDAKFSSPSKLSLRFGPASDLNAAQASGHLNIVGDNVAVQYDALEVNCEVFFEIPVESNVEGTSTIISDPYDIFMDHDNTTLKFGMLELQFVQNAGTPFSAGVDGFTVCNARIGNSAWQTRNLGNIRSKWIQIKGSYDGQNGSGTVEIKIEHKIKTAMAFSGLVNLEILSRSNTEFVLSTDFSVDGIQISNPQVMSGGGYDSTNVAQNVYIDDLNIRVTSI